MNASAARRSLRASTGPSYAAVDAGGRTQPLRASPQRAAANESSMRKSVSFVSPLRASKASAAKSSYTPNMSAATRATAANTNSAYLSRHYDQSIREQETEAGMVHMLSEQV